jgi:hypothetical protein
MIQSQTVERAGLLATRFIAAYRRSLSDYRLFYDDIAEIGNPSRAKHAFYFVPGISGSPGQMRFALPSLSRTFGPRVYMKGLDVPAFATGVPVWDKYTVPNTERKLAQLREDLTALLHRFDRLVVVCSSNGLYDFLAAAAKFPRGDLESRVQLVWVSCAPDHYSPTVWERVFFPINGVVVQGHRWFAYPNHDTLRMLNPETTNSLFWREGHQERRFDKADLESRFRCLGVHWDYISTSRFGEIAEHVIAQIRPWNAPVQALIAADDGYWQGVPEETVLTTIRRYVPQAHCTFRPGSHAGVVTPTNLTEVFARVLSALQAKAVVRRRPSMRFMQETMLATGS